MSKKVVKEARSYRRHNGIAHLVEIIVDRSSDIPFSFQLYMALRSEIVSGRIPAGARLPSTRDASETWKVSRSIVIEAYDSLMGEGLAFGQPGSGTYVTTKFQEFETPSRRLMSYARPSPRRVSDAAIAARGSAHIMEMQRQVPFALGRAMPDAQTNSVLSRLGRRHAARFGTFQSDYRDPQGEPSVREAIASYLRASRGVRCDASKVIIVSGAQQAIDIAARVLINPGDAVWVENPCYPSALRTFALNNAKLIPVPVDGQGLNVASGVGIFAEARAVYVTPSHQYPTGHVLAMERRLALLEWAREVGAWIIEDDYDSEFRYDGTPLASLQGLDEDDRVIYIGSFSKSLFPGLRVGYLVVPHDLLEIFRSVRAIVDRFPSPFHQLVLADFLSEGYFVGHLRRLRNTYRRSRDLLAGLIEENGNGIFNVVRPSQGLHLVAHLRDDTKSDVLMAKEASKMGAVVRPISPMYVLQDKVFQQQGFMLGFTGYSEAELERGVQRLILSQSLVM